jgi:hypothetical protein
MFSFSTIFRNETRTNILIMKKKFLNTDTEFFFSVKDWSWREGYPYGLGCCVKQYRGEQNGAGITQLITEKLIFKMFFFAGEIALQYRSVFDNA